MWLNQNNTLCEWPLTLRISPTSGFILFFLIMCLFFCWILSWSLEIMSLLRFLIFRKLSCFWNFVLFILVMFIWVCFHFFFFWFWVDCDISSISVWNYLLCIACAMWYIMFELSVTPWLWKGFFHFWSCRVGLPLVFKSSFDKANRTSSKSFRGPGMTEGLKVDSCHQNFCFVLCEILDPAKVGYCTCASFIFFFMFGGRS